jgi:hypothetical protein
MNELYLQLCFPAVLENAPSLLRLGAKKSVFFTKCSILSNFKAKIQK